MRWPLGEAMLDNAALQDSLEKRLTPAARLRRWSGC
jgi:hypothetical protein